MSLYSYQVAVAGLDPHHGALLLELTQLSYPAGLRRPPHLATFLLQLLAEHLEHCNRRGPLVQALAERGLCSPGGPSRADLSTLICGARLIELHNDPDQVPTGEDWPQDAPLADPVEPERRVRASVELRFADPALLAELREGERWSTHRWPPRA